ncbi:MAG: group II intron reverse transcriptase domain-containing protein [Polyangiaceae bacterium]|nr:group II intron reverse transcriptase domain-containing protein [Polyangiaceae bacterium]
MTDSTPVCRPEEVTLDTLRAMAARAARGKRHSPDVARFLVDIDQELVKLGREIRTREYAPQPGRPLRIRDPKPRWITVVPFRDRVVQHLLIAATLPALERRFAPQSYACRRGFGTHRALQRARDWTRRRDFVLRLDIAKFFPSIDHACLKRMLLRVTEPPWRWLSDRFVDAPYCGERFVSWFPGDGLLTPLEHPHGLSIGSLTSQIWANLYLSPLDHLLASHLGIGSFVRYCDDWLIWDDDPGRLREVLLRLEEHAATLRLKLHPRKTRLYRTTEPVPFLGFVLQRRGSAVSVRLRPENLRRFRKRMRKVQALYAAGALEAHEVRSRVQAWLAHARHGHTRTLVRRVLSELVFRR